jgi:hypothetical protein
MSAPSAPPDFANLSGPALTNPAVASCRQAHTQAWKVVFAKGEANISPKKLLKKAFRNAMPPLSGSWPPSNRHKPKLAVSEMTPV